MTDPMRVAPTATGRDLERSGRSTVDHVLRRLLTRRWLSLLGAVAVLAPTFVALGLWQLDRLEQRRDRNAGITRNIDHEPVPLDELLSLSQPVDKPIEWRQVTMTGRYDAGRTVLVRNRTSTDNGPPGFHVLVPLVAGTGAALLVDRGWIPYGQTATETPTPPAPPSGPVTVVGRLRPTEHGGIGAGLPTGQVARFDVPEIGASLPYDVYDGFAELVSENPSPASAPTPLDEPSPSDGPHLSYAVQWFVFAAIAVSGFCYLFVREAREEPATKPPALIPRQQART